MAIDYIIAYDCKPKQALSTAGILERLKERERAREVIEWFRSAGDDRPPDQMGFEFSQSTPQTSGEKQLIVVQDLLDHAAVLDDYAETCRGCPANVTGSPYGCIGFINYPISALAETWLLERLPVPDEPVVWLLLRQGIRTLGYDGSSVKTLRAADGNAGGKGRTYFELPNAPQRRLGELQVDSDQILEMVFGVGDLIIPNHAGILLLFFNVIERDLEAEVIQEISSFDFAARETVAFQMTLPTEYDACIGEFIAFFHALYTSWKLNMPLYIDA
ncbi:MAG: hypothetical protein OXG78_09750 [Chloroflexi bacterium]|nr:hypothetical protein [Chloroflexota bacterium]